MYGVKHVFSSEKPEGKTCRMKIVSALLKLIIVYEEKVFLEYVGF